jgi:hypothetical protein
MATQTEILKQALTLPPEARAALADSLLDSLDTDVDEDAAEQWRLGFASGWRSWMLGRLRRSRGKTCGSGLPGKGAA